MDLSNDLRALATQIDAIASEVDEAWKAADRARLSRPAGIPQDEQETQKLAALSRGLWEAYRFLAKTGIPVADRLAARPGTTA